MNFEIKTKRRWWAVIMLLGLIILSFILGKADPALNIMHKNLAPSWSHLFGTDWLGRDMLQRSGAAMIKSIWLGGIAVAISCCIALAFAFLAQCNRICRNCVLLLCDLVMSLPHLLLLILLVLAFGGSEQGVILSLALSHWPKLTRLLLMEMDDVLSKSYVAIALNFGGSRIKTMTRHLLPHIFPQWLVGGVNLFPHVLLHVSGLSFLGFGLDGQNPSMGELLAEVNAYILLGQWWLALFPGLLLVTVVILLAMCGNILTKNISGDRTTNIGNATPKKGVL